VRGGGDFVEIGGRKYPVVKIGNQLWMAENLDYKFQVNGSQIPIGGDAGTDPRAWYYNGDETTYGIDGPYKCGLYYNWYATKYLDDNKSTLLPNGWHVPTATEISTLSSAVGDSANKLKAESNSLLQGFPANWNGTNETQMSLLPCGSTLGWFNVDCSCWTVSESSSSNGRNLYIDSSNSININGNSKQYGFSLRLVKDAT
jgi:uncharacterized protein (TIGR02145 family)